jgi:hypothetical protein
MALFWLGSVQKAQAQITVINSSDCLFNLTIRCGNTSVTQSSSTFSGSWLAPNTTTFNMPCCPNPVITIDFAPVYGTGVDVGPIAVNSIDSTAVYGCYKLKDCMPVNAAFNIKWNALTCTLTLAKPSICP